MWYASNPDFEWKREKQWVIDEIWTAYLLFTAPKDFRRTNAFRQSPISESSGISSFRQFVSTLGTVLFCWYFRWNSSYPHTLETLVIKLVVYLHYVAPKCSYHITIFHIYNSELFNRIWLQNITNLVCYLAKLIESKSHFRSSSFVA